MIDLLDNKKVAEVQVSFKKNGYVLTVHNVGTYGTDKLGECISTNFGDVLALLSKVNIHNDMLDAEARIKKEAEARRKAGEVEPKADGL